MALFLFLQLYYELRGLSPCHKSEMFSHGVESPVDNQVASTMIMEQISKLEKSIAGIVACEISVLRSLLQCNSDDMHRKLFALEGRILSALESHAHEAKEREGNGCISTKSDENAACSVANCLRAHDVVTKRRTPSTPKFRARLTVSKTQGSLTTVFLKKEAEAASSGGNEVGKLVTAESISPPQTALSFRHGRIKHVLEISISPHNEQNSLPSPARGLHDTPALGVEPQYTVDTDQGIAQADARLETDASIHPPPPAAGEHPRAETRSLFLAVATAAGSNRALLIGGGREGSAIYQPHELTRKVPTLRLCGADRALRAALEAVFGISDPNIWVGHPGSSLIHPSSGFSAGSSPPLPMMELPPPHDTPPLPSLSPSPSPPLSPPPLHHPFRHGAHLRDPPHLLRVHRARPALLLEHVRTHARTHARTRTRSRTQTQTLALTKTKTHNEHAQTHKQCVCVLCIYIYVHI